MYLDDAAARLVIDEEPIGWMYRDTLGNMTAATGKLLREFGDALALPFKVGDRRATPAELAGEWNRVHAMAFGQAFAARHFKSAVSPLLGEEDMASLLRKRIEADDAELTKRLPGYAAAPDAAKVALLNMAYNLGDYGLEGRYPTLDGAVERGDWGQAAEECHRHGISEARNEWTREMFLKLVACAA